MEIFVLLMDQTDMKVEWKYVILTTPGEQCVMIPGIQLMLKLCADSWDILLTMLHHSIMLDLVKEHQVFIWMMCHVLVMNHFCFIVITPVPTTAITMKMLVLNVVVMVSHFNNLCLYIIHVL